MIPPAGISNNERKFVVLMVLREAQNHKNYNKHFSYFELQTDG